MFFSGSILDKYPKAFYHRLGSIIHICTFEPDFMVDSAVQYIYQKLLSRNMVVNYKIFSSHIIRLHKDVSVGYF